MDHSIEDSADPTEWDDKIQISLEILSVLALENPLPPVKTLKIVQADTSSSNFEKTKESWLPSLKELSNYRLLKKLALGSHSTVYKARKLDTKQLVGLKVYERGKLNELEEKNVEKEIQLLKNLPFPPETIIHLLDSITSPTHTTLVLPLTHTDLFHEVVRRGKFTEDDSRAVIKNVLSAVDYLHEQVGIVHRDIKLENLLVEYEYDYDDDVQDRKIRKVILTDFALAKVLWNQSTSTPCGTVEYVAPEVLQRQYSKAVDLWGIGCVLYTLLCGFPPFYHDDLQELMRLISTANFSFPSPWWDEISEDVKMVISGLFRMEPLRWNVQDVLNSPWMKKESVLQLEADKSWPPPPAILATPASELSLRLRNATNTSSTSGELNPIMVDRPRQTTNQSQTTVSSDPLSGKRGGRRASLQGWIMPNGPLHTPADLTPIKSPTSPLIRTIVSKIETPKESPPDKLPPSMASPISNSSFASLSLASPKSQNTSDSDYFEHGTLRKKKFDERREWEKSRHHRRGHQTGQAPFEVEMDPTQGQSREPGQVFVSPLEMEEDQVVQAIPGSRWQEQSIGGSTESSGDCKSTDSMIDSKVDSRVDSRVDSQDFVSAASSMGRADSNHTSASFVSALSQGINFVSPLPLPTPLNKHTLDTSYWAVRNVFDKEKVLSPTSPKSPRIFKTPRSPHSPLPSSPLTREVFKPRMDPGKSPVGEHLPPSPHIPPSPPKKMKKSAFEFSDLNQSTILARRTKKKGSETSSH